MRPYLTDYSPTMTAEYHYAVFYRHLGQDTPTFYSYALHRTFSIERNAKLEALCSRVEDNLRKEGIPPTSVRPRLVGHKTDFSRFHMWVYRVSLMPYGDCTAHTGGPQPLSDFSGSLKNSPPRAVINHFGTVDEKYVEEKLILLDRAVHFWKVEESGLRNLHLVFLIGV